MDDVIIVGAGPAGNNTALGLASRGYAVTVIDARHTIGEKLCTGIVGRECTRRFPIDPSLVYQDASAADVTAPGAKNVRFEASGPQGQIINRVDYVASFARRAQEQGATYLLGERVQEVSPDADGVFGRPKTRDSIQSPFLENPRSPSPDPDIGSGRPTPVDNSDTRTGHK